MMIMMMLMIMMRLAPGKGEKLKGKTKKDKTSGELPARVKKPKWTFVCYVVSLVVAAIRPPPQAARRQSLTP